MIKHTAAPWRVENETDIVGFENDPANDCVGPVDIAQVYPRTVPNRTEANARLIAAAPELLEFAESYIGMFCGYQITNTSDAKHDATGWLRDMARDAIDKATGKL